MNNITTLHKEIQPMDCYQDLTHLHNNQRV